jgi:hypothetical protein
MTTRSRLAYLFEPAGPGDMQVALRCRILPKWILELARNLMILGVLRFVAERTDSGYAWQIYYLCFTAVCFYIISFWQAWV